MKKASPLLLLAICLVVTSCSSSLPGDQVANVSRAKDGAISQTDYQVWSRIALKSNPSQNEESIRPQVMRFLISSRWIEAEAEEQNIQLTQAELQKAYLQQSRAAFKTEQQKQAFLKQTGMKEVDLIFRAKVNLLASKLREQASQKPPKVSDREIVKFYNQNIKRFGEAKSRDVLIIRTKDFAQALIAKARLKEGESFSKIAAIYSDDDGSKAHGGMLRVNNDGFISKPLEKAIFSAQKDVLVGPVKVASNVNEINYYVFEVQKDNPSSRQPLSQERPVIVQLIESQKKRQQVAEFLSQLERQWKPRTECKDGFVIESCNNFSGQN
jgi:foldase protein PrsA